MPFSFAEDEPKNRLISAKRGLIESIHIIDEKGTEMRVIYDSIDSCMICNNERLFNGSSCGCPVCDQIMTEVEYNESQKEAEVVLDLSPDVPEISIKKEPEPTIATEPTFQMVEEPEAIMTFETEAEIVEQKETIETALAITTTTPDFTAIQNARPLTFEEKKVKIVQTMELIEYTANNALNKEDFWTPKGSRKKALTRSGCNKLATIFNITTETIKIWVVKEVNIKGAEDIVAYATVKATRPGGSSVTVTANKALSEYESDRPGAKPPREWVDMQALKGTAETRASNRAIQNAIGVVPKGYMVATAEEFNRKG